MTLLLLRLLLLFSLFFAWRLCVCFFALAPPPLFPSSPFALFPLFVPAPCSIHFPPAFWPPPLFFHFSVAPAFRLPLLSPFAIFIARVETARSANAMLVLPSSAPFRHDSINTWT